MNHELKCKLIFTFYCLTKLSLVAAYITLMIYLWNYSVAIIIAVHGGWNFIWTMLWTSATGFIIGALLFAPLPKAPQTPLINRITHKETTS